MVWGAANLKSCDTVLKKVEDNDPNLKDLVILPIKSFGDAEVDRLIQAFRSGKNTSLQSIQASGHELSTSTLFNLASSLISCGLKSISIGHSTMGDEGVIALCSPLEPHNGGSIQKIDFEFKNLGSKGLEAIGRAFRSSNLLELRLSRNPHIGDDGCKAFATVITSYSDDNVFPSLEYLDMSACNIGSSGLADLTKFLCMRKLNSPRLDFRLDFNPLGASSCHSLSVLLSRSALSSLSVKGCCIGDDGIGILNSSIHQSSFSGRNDVRSDDIIEQVDRCEANFSGLTSINLSDNNIGPDGARFIANIILSGNQTMSIKELNLSKNPLGPEGVTVLSNALRKRRRLDSLIMLHSLDLSGTDCGKEGASSALTCDAVQRLNLFNNGLGADNFSSIATHLVGGHHSLETIDLGGNLADSNAVLEILNALAQKSESFENRLKTIILGGNTTNDIIYSLVRKIAIIHPELDVAMDRPTNEEERFN